MLSRCTAKEICRKETNDAKRCETKQNETKRKNVVGTNRPTDRPPVLVHRKKRLGRTTFVVEKVPLLCVFAYRTGVMRCWFWRWLARNEPKSNTKKMTCPCFVFWRSGIVVDFVAVWGQDVRGPGEGVWHVSASAFAWSGGTVVFFVLQTPFDRRPDSGWLLLAAVAAHDQGRPSWAHPALFSRIPEKYASSSNNALEAWRGYFGSLHHFSGSQT
jgi:hypothetical protein